jgi:hypothetical protein
MAVAAEPEARGWQDIDNLREGRGAEDVDRSEATLIFMTAGYLEVLLPPPCVYWTRPRWSTLPVLLVLTTERQLHARASPCAPVWQARDYPL